MSANQGKVLNEKVAQVETDLNMISYNVPTGKNLYDNSSNYRGDGFYGTDLKWVDNILFDVTSLIPVIPGSKYTVSGNLTYNYLYGFNSFGKILGISNPVVSTGSYRIYSFTTNVHYIAFCIPKSNRQLFDNLQVEYGEASTAFEQFKSEVKSAYSFENENIKSIKAAVDKLAISGLDSTFTDDAPVFTQTVTKIGESVDISFSSNPRIMSDDGRSMYLFPSHDIYTTVHLIGVTAQEEGEWSN